jgi:hypothetical protein
MGLIGTTREAADVPDEIVADAMRQQREEPWRVNPAPGRRLALPVLSGKKELLVTRNDIAGFVH